LPPLLFSNPFETVGLEPFELFPAQKLIVQLLQASIDQELIHLLASNRAVQQITEDFNKPLDQATDPTEVSRTSRVATDNSLDLRWDVEPESVSTSTILSYQDLQREPSWPQLAFIQSSSGDELLSRTLSTQVSASGEVQRVAAFSEFPRLELSLDPDEGDHSNVYAAYWLPTGGGKIDDIDGKTSIANPLTFNWLREFEAQFNDFAEKKTSEQFDDPLASMLAIQFMDPVDVHSINLEVAFVGNLLGGKFALDPNTDTFDPGFQPFRVAQYVIDGIDDNGEPIFVLADERITWLQGNQLYQ
jgi:hypothetical protein